MADASKYEDISWKIRDDRLNDKFEKNAQMSFYEIYFRL